LDSTPSAARSRPAHRTTRARRGRAVRGVPIFLDALADEAADGLQLLCDLERSWFAARRAATAGRRSTSRAAAAVDILAAAPLASATTLAAGLGMAVKNAIVLLDWFAEAGIVVEVTRRSKRRLFGLAGLAPLRDEVAPPRPLEPGRGRGRPPTAVEQEGPPPALLLPDRPLTSIERKSIDYSDLEHWMAQANRVIRDTRQTLDALARRNTPTKADDGAADIELAPRRAREGMWDRR